MDNKTNRLSRFGLIVFCIYLFLSIFESYINQAIGDVSKFYIIFVIIYLFLTLRKFKLSIIGLTLLMWIIYYTITLIWTPNIEQASLYYFSVPMMVLLTIQTDQLRPKHNQLDTLLKVYQYSSSALGLLGCFFSKTTIVGSTARYTLVLWGNTLDPNNLVALYSISFVISIYYIMFTNEKKIINICLIAINTFVILYTGSRSGIIIVLSIIIIAAYYKSKNISYLKIILLLTTLLFILYLSFNIFKRYLPEDVFVRLFGLGDLEFSDSTDRNSLWQNALSDWYNNYGIFFGLGWGAHPAHNTFITILVDVGILGLSLFISAIYRLIRKAVKQRNVLALMLFTSCIIQAFFIDAQIKRFFWNAIILPIILTNISYGSKSCNNTPQNQQNV